MAQSFFAAQTEKVQIDADNWAVVRKLTFEERQTIFGNTMAMRSDGEGVDLNVGQFQLQLLQTVVTDWGGPGFEGRRPTKDNIGALPPWLADKLFEVANELNADVTEDEAKNSDEPTNTPSSKDVK